MSYLNPATLAQLKAEFALDSFIETGCFEGAGIAAAFDAGLDRICSCDISADRVNQCRERFRGRDGLSLFEGTSLSVLPKMVPAAGMAPLVWLDAHFPSYYGLE